MNRRLRTWGLEVSSERVTGGIVLVVKGRIGNESAPVFRDALTTALAAVPRVIVDLTSVDYMSGAGISALRQAAGQNGAQTILCGLHDAVRITLELSGALDRFLILNSRQEAIESLITNH